MAVPSKFVSVAVSEGSIIALDDLGVLWITTFEKGDDWKKLKA